MLIVGTVSSHSLVSVLPPHIKFAHSNPLSSVTLFLESDVEFINNLPLTILLGLPQSISMESVEMTYFSSSCELHDYFLSIDFSQTPKNTRNVSNPFPETPSALRFYFLEFDLKYQPNKIMALKVNAFLGSDDTAEEESSSIREGNSDYVEFAGDVLEPIYVAVVSEIIDGEEANFMVFAENRNLPLTGALRKAKEQVELASKTTASGQNNIGASFTGVIEADLIENAGRFRLEITEKFSFGVKAEASASISEISSDGIETVMPGTIFEASLSHDLQVLELRIQNSSESFNAWKLKT